MKIYARGDGRFLVKYKDPKSGKWVQKAFREKSEAQAFIAKMGGYEEGTRLTVNECCLQYAASRELSKRRMKDVALTLKGIASDISEKFVDELKLFDLERVQRKGKALGLSNSTVNLKVSILKAAFNWAAQHDLLLLNPWGKYKNLKNDSVSRKADLGDFLEVYKWLPDWAQWACRTCIALCLRPGEAEMTSLKWEAFNWRKGNVTVFMPKVKQTKVVYPPKEYLAEAEERCKNAVCEFVVPSYRNKKLGYKSFRVAWYNTARKTGIKISPYCMRHLAASLALEGGGSLTSIAAQLGHQRVQTTETYYLHGSEKGQRQASEALPYTDIFKIEEKG